MLKFFQKITYPLSYLIHHFDDIPRDLTHHTNALLNDRFHQTNSLLAEIRNNTNSLLTEFRNQTSLLTEIRNLELLAKNEVFKDHLAALSAGGETEFPEVSYTLRCCARSLYVDSDRGKSGHDTAICTVALGDNYRKAVDYCLQSHRIYAERAAADYVQLHLSPAHINHHAAWYKIALIYKLLHEGYERVLLIDADALVTNYAIPIDSLFEPLRAGRQALYLAEDESGVNTGVMLVKRTPAAYRLLDVIWTHNLGRHITNWEQQALIDLMNSHRVIGDYVLIAPDAKAFNSFPYEREHAFRVIQENNWTPGDFICHFSGIPSPQLEKMILYYIDEYGLGAGLELHEADLPKKR